MQAPSVCVLIVIFKPNFPVDSPNSNLHFFPHCYGGHSARHPSRKHGDWDEIIMFSFVTANNGQTTVTECESFVFTCLTYKNVQRFRNGPVHEFYGLKASQISKAHASSHEYPHVEKSRIFGTRISKVRCQGKRINLTAKRKTSQKKKITSQQKE